MKTVPPESLAQALQRNPHLTWEEFCKRAYMDAKSKLGEYLRAEQGYLCCYCEEEIVKGVSHIEHFMPKSIYPQFGLDYHNLFASCNGCGKDGDLTCGMKKRDIYFRTLIKPTEENCEERFIYTADGQILPKDEEDEIAWQTIAVLGLNSPKLRRRREMLFEEISNLRSLLPPWDFARYIAIRLEKNPRGRFCEFWTTVRYFAPDVF
ncbi:MAG: retron system putative HNH endonuclease [Planctomycetia bacterium]|nr:retron system putative HNH endonuclease [Planctomycetia bacterium]